MVNVTLKECFQRIKKMLGKRKRRAACLLNVHEMPDIRTRAAFIHQSLSQVLSMQNPEPKRQSECGACASRWGGWELMESM